MWGNWSTTVRRTRLTPSYANTANLASDTIINEPKYSSIAALHAVLNDYAATILHTPIDSAGLVEVRRGIAEREATRERLLEEGGDVSVTGTDYDQWMVTLNGTEGGTDPPITFVFNDSPNVTDVRLRARACTFLCFLTLAPTPF